MGIPLSGEELNLFRSFIQKECGIAIGEEKAYLVEHRLAPLVQDVGCRSYQDLYFQARHGQDAVLRERIIDALTTSETMWFRDQWPFAVFLEKLLPRWVAELREGRRSDVRIWSAACSTGQEPYSIRMAILEHARRNRVPELEDQRLVTILATEVSAASLARARQGRFCELHMRRGLPPEFRDRYFRRAGEEHQISGEVRAGVDFRRQNLRDDFTGLGRFDLIFLRNVAIYFAREFKEELCARLAGALRPDGCLLLGATESLTGLRHGFEQVADGRALYYRLKK